MSTFNDGGHVGDADAEARLAAFGSDGRKLLAVRQHDLLPDEGVLLGRGVLHPADVVLQDFALVPAELPGDGLPAPILAEGEGGEAEGGHGILRAALGQAPEKGKDNFY